MADNNEITTNPERDRLNSKVWDYVRAGWTVSDRTGLRVRLYKGEQTVNLSLDEQGQVVVDGPTLPAFYIDGRARAWLLLLALLIIVFGTAWLSGFFRP
jgi:hypothetical protein